MDNVPQGGTSDGGGDVLDTILGTSGQSDTAGTGGGESQSAQGAASAQQGQTFRFANREYPNQSVAEKEFNKLYGKFSDSQGLQKQLVNLLRRDPNALRELVKDPEWADTLSKLGIDAASKDVSERQDRERAEGSQDWEQYRQEFDVERHQFRLEREQWQFEKKLGRDLSSDELREVYGLIENSPSLTMEQAYKLAYHDKLLKEAASKGNGRPAPSSRPKPPPALGITGEKLDLTKPLHKMTKQEQDAAFRADVRAGLAR